MAHNNVLVFFLENSFPIIHIKFSLFIPDGYKLYYFDMKMGMNSICLGKFES